MTVEKVYLQLELKSHQEDHDGYCSGADIDVEDEEVTMIMSISLLQEIRLKTRLEMLNLFPNELNKIIMLYLYELPDTIVKTLESERELCNETPEHENEFGDLRHSTRSHYCKTEPSFIRIENYKMIEKKEYDKLQLIQSLPIPQCVNVPRDTDYKIIFYNRTTKVETDADKYDKIEKPWDKDPWDW